MRNPISLRYPSPVQLVTVAAAVACVAVVGWRAVRMASVPAAAAAPSVAAGTPAQTGEGATLFGATPAKAGPRVTVGGVVQAVGSNEGAAVLSIDGGTARLVRVGKEVLPGVVLTALRPRAIVLSRNGVEQEVTIAPVSMRALKFTDATSPGRALVSNVPRQAARGGASAPSD